MAVDGQQAVEMAAATAPDLILMDMSLPVLDGWEATRRILPPILPCNLRHQIAPKGPTHHCHSVDFF